MAGARNLTLADDLRDLIEHDTESARAILRQIIDALPRSTDALSLLAAAHVRRLEFTQASVLFARVLDIDPRHEEALNMVGFCALASGDLQSALAAYERTFAATSSARSLRFMALLQHRLGRIELAIATYQRLLRAAQPTSPEIPVALQGLIAALRDAERPLLAEHYVQQLHDQFLRQPTTTASSLVDRNNSEDFHEWSLLADKALLAQALTARLTRDAVGGRVPESFVLPEDRTALAQLAAGPNPPSLYIVKPIRSSGGQGITVVSDIAQTLDQHDVVVQRYVSNPYLAEGRKGHARIYGLITCAEPLRAYVYREGIIRFAPELYDPSPQAAGNAAIHITNTALHAGHAGLVISADPTQEDVGAVWSLSALLRHMSANGLDGQKAFEEIKDLVTWFVRMLAADGLFARQSTGPARAFAPKLFGLDVLIDDRGHPWLIEMQRKPAATGQALVERINGTLYCDIFRMSQSPLLDDQLSPERVAAILRDPSALAARELEIETELCGQFIRLDLDA